MTGASSNRAVKVRRIDFNPADFLTGTAGLTPEETGIYWKVCCLIYLKSAAIDDDEDWIRKAIACDVRTWRRLRQSLIDKGKLILDAGKLTNPRCQTEINAATHRIKTARENGDRGGRPPRRR